nr:hypothetical protein [Tanacetum cinerariifolium]
RLLYEEGRYIMSYEISRSFVDSRFKSIEQILNNFPNQPNETNMNNLESDEESVDTPLVSPFPYSDNDSDDGEVVNELMSTRILEFYAEKGMPRTRPRLKKFNWDKVPPLLELSQHDLMRGLRHPYE